MNRCLCLSLLTVFAGSALALVPNATGTFPGVGRMGNIVSGNMTTTGTAFAISPTWILSAAHVGGSRFEQDGVIYNVLQTIQHPTADLSLRRISGPVKTALPIKLDVFPAGLPAAQTAMAGDILKISGYGISANQTATGWQFIAGSEGVRRRCRNAMDLYYPNIQLDIGGGNIKTSNYVMYDLDDPAGVSTVNILGGLAVGTDEGGMATNDSGCPWTVNTNGRDRAIGVGGIVGVFQGTGVVRPYDWGGFGAAVILQGYETWFMPFISDYGRAIMDAVSFEIGSQTGGTLQSIAESDDNRLTTRTDTTAVDSDTQLGMIFYGTTTHSTGTINVTLEGRLSASSSIVAVRLKNWTTNQFVTVGTTTISNLETTRSVNGIPATSYINPQGQIEMNLRFTPTTEDTRLLDGYFDVVRIDVNGS